MVGRRAGSIHPAIARDALISGARSGSLSASIGVGTVTM
jgi:hypothetical protein